jgi:hypothetical protein
MHDPRLNSIHLPAPRREVFRRARQEMLLSAGEYTLCGARLGDAEDSGSPTIIGKVGGGAAPSGLDCWLADGEFIYPLKVGVTTVGRAPENDIIVEDAFVSRRQCAILMHHNARCEIHDTASKNGTYLNGARVAAPSALKTGDRITVNDRHFTFMSKAAGPPSDGPVTLAG